MHAPKTPSRRRTRSQWDEYYRNCYNELRRNNGKSGGTGEGEKRVTNVVDSESIVVDEDSGKSEEKQDLVNIGEKNSDEKNIEQSESSGRRGVRSKECSGSGSVEEDVRKKKLGVRKKKLDVRTTNDGDIVLKSEDDVEYLGEEVVSNGSSLKVGNLDEVVSCSTKEDGRGGGDNGGSGGKRRRGRPRKHVDGRDISHDVSVDSETSSKSSDGSDESDDLCMSESESSSEEDDEFSDDDYDVNEDEPSTSDDSEVLYCCSDGEGEHDIDDENECLVKEEEISSNNMDDKRTTCTDRKSMMINVKESDGEQKDHISDEGRNKHNDDGDGSSRNKRSSNHHKQEDMIIIVDGEDKFPSVSKSARISGTKENDVKQERDYKIDEGRHAIFACSGCYKTSANRKKEGLVINVNDNEKFPRVRKSARINQTRLPGLSTIREPCNKGCMNETREGDCNGTLTVHDESKEIDDKIKESGLKKRKGFGLEIFLNANKINDRGDESLARCKISKDKSASSDEDICHIEGFIGRGSKKVAKLEKKTRVATNLDLIKILLESINSLKDEQSSAKENDLTQTTLPKRFCFEDEVQPPPPEKSEWEKEIDSLFCDLELGLRESEIDCTDSPVMENDDPISMEIDQSPAACCSRGEHQHILDEQIGIVCKYCTAVILDIKYVLPPFYIPPPGRRDTKYFEESPPSIISQIQFQDSTWEIPGSFFHAKGTVWDLIPGVEKGMYPHQREGFEFMWKNIAGDVILEKLRQPLSDGGRGCIISHAPGTGKTRLTIAFLVTFMKLYPSCRPVIIAPRGMLLTWESEFIKWNINIPIHNLNREELTGHENAVAANVVGQVSSAGLSRDHIRLVKLYSWVKGRSILGISYQLFGKLAGENRKGLVKEQTRKLLLETPGLLVLDEGHTPRNDQSQIWKALAKVATQRRIILSGTPFQNNLSELYNTLCLVNPRLVNQIVSEISISCELKSRAARKRWMNLTSSIGKNRDYGLKRLRAMLDPFVHVHEGTILEENLPGLRDTLVFLHPTQLQKTLMKASCKAQIIFHRIWLFSLVSVHPSLVAGIDRFSAYQDKLEEIKSDIDAGVKTKFVLKLIYLAGALGERVLIFSQFIDPLIFLKNQIKSHFSWIEGREVLYMDGQLDEKQRQDSISSFNDDKSNAKVLLASKRACSEGISLVGASRVILLDILWNPSLEKQAISRAYRLGQKKVVYVYRLFTSGVEVKQYAQQVQKERISQLIFSPVDRQTCQRDNKSSVVLEDKVLEAMLGLERFNRMFEKIIQEPKESDLIETFGLNTL